MKKFFIVILCIAAFCGMVAYNVNHNKIDEEKEVVVAAFLPLTGVLSSYGTAARDGIAVGIDMQNQKGGFNGKKIIFKAVDTMGDPKEAITLFYSQFEQQKPLMIFSSNTGVALNLQKLTEPRKIPLISPVSGDEFLKKENRFSLRGMPLPGDFANYVAEYLKQHHPNKKIKFFYENVDYSIANKRALQGIYNTDEIEIVDFDTKTLDYRPLLLKTKLDSQKDVVVLSALGATAGRMIRQMREVGYMGDILGDSTLTLKGVIDIAGGAMKNVYSLIYVKDDSEQCRQLYTAYEKRSGRKMDFPALNAYQDTQLLLQFLSENPNVTDLRNQIEGKSFDGCLKEIKVLDGQLIFQQHFIDMEKFE